MDFHTMKRKELQALCKTHKIPANLTNLEMANRLASLLEVDKEKPPKQRVNSVKSCLKILDDLVDVDEKRSEDKLGKKVRFSPQDQTFEFEKTNPKEMRLARRKSVVLAEDKINTGVKVNESVDVVNQVKSMRTRGRGRNPEQADVEDSKLLAKKKAEEIDGSTKTLRKRTSFVADCEVQPLVDARRHKAAKDTASEATKPVTRRSVRIVERPDESASVIEQVEIDNLPKRKTTSDWPENQEMEKDPTRCLRRNISKDACSKEVEELKEQGNGTSRVTRKTRQQKGYIGLNETVSAAESAPVEKASTRAEELKEQGNEKAKVMRKTRQQKGDIGLNETVSGAESAPVEKPSTRAEALKEQGKGKAKVTRQTCQQKGDIGLKETVSATERATVVDKASKRCLRKNTSKDAGGKAAEEAKELGNKKGRVTRTSRLQKGDIELNETVSAMESADVVEHGQQRRSTRVAIKRCSLAPGELNIKKPDVDVQQRGVTLKSKESRKQDNSSHPGNSDEHTRCVDKRKLSTKIHGEGLQTDLEVAPLTVNSEIFSVCEEGDIQNKLCNESSTLEHNQDNDKSLHQTTPTPLLKERELTNAETKTELKNGLAKQKGVLLELYSSDGQLTEGDGDEPDIDKEEDSKEAVILYGISLDDAEVVLLPSMEFQASPCGTSSTVSRSFTEGSKKELENTVSRADYFDKIDPALTSTSTDTFTGISFPECESGSQGIYQPQLETAIPSSLIVESDADISNFVEGSSVKNTELEEHTLCAENQSGDALEECNALEFYNLKCQISKDESTVHTLGLESHPSLLESQSWLDKPAAVLEMSTLGSTEPVNPQVDTCIDRLGVYERGKNTGQEESEGVTPTPMADERSEGIDTYISDGSVDPAECKRSHKQGVEEESDSPMTSHEQTYDIASLFQLDNAEQDSVVISNGLEGKNITEVSDVQLNDGQENNGVLADQYLEVYMEKAGKNEGYYQEAEGDSPTATDHELSESIDTCRSDRSYDLKEFVKSHKQGLKEETTSQMAIHQETNKMIASFFQLESAERDSEATYDIALLFQLEDAERVRVVTSNDLEESKVEEVSDAQRNDNLEDEIFADKKLEVNEEEGKSCSEVYEISGIVNESAVSLEEAICVGSTTMVHKVSSPRSYYNNKLELVGGLKKQEELTYMDYTDKLPAQRSSLSFEEDAFMAEARESDPQNLTDMHSGCADEKMHTLQQVTTELISMHGSGHMDDSESDSEISSEDKSGEEKGATVTPNDCLPMPYALEHVDANNNYEITQEVSKKVACPLEEYMVVASEATQDGVTPNSYSPKANSSGLSHPMHQEEYENNDKNEAEPNVLEGSEEKLFSPSSVEEANAIDEDIESEDSRATVEAIAPSPEAVCPVDEFYSIKHIEPEEDILGLAILERISEQTGDQGSSEISGDSELHEPDDDKEFEKNAFFTLEPEEADNKVYKEALIHNGYSSEDSENVLLCSDRVKGSPPKESEGWTSMEKVDEIFGGFVVDSFVSDRTDDYAGSEGSHKQGLNKESNLELSVHRGVHVLEDENAPTDEANEDVSVDLMKQDKGLVGETLEGENGRIEPPMTASFPEMSSISPDDESKNADVKGISNEYVFGGSGHEPLIRSVVDDNPIAVNMEIDALGGSAQLLTQLPEPSYPVDKMDATEHICEDEDVHIHDANNNYEITQEVCGEVAFSLEKYTVLESEATQDAVTPDSYSPKPSPAGLSHPMDQEEYENVYKNEAAPNVLEGSEEKLVSPSSVEEATTSDENIESDDSRGTVEAIAPFQEAVCPVDELYSIKDIEPEEDFLGLAILERISEHTGDQGSSEISGDSELHEPDDDKEFEENASFTLEPEEADSKVYKEAQIHNGYSSEDSENVLLCSDRVKGSPPKELEGWTSMEKVDKIFGGFVVDSFVCDRTDDYAGSEGSHKQGLTKENNLQLSVHEGVHVLEDENAPTDEGNKDVSVDLMKQDKGLVGETLEGENGRIEPPVTASFPEMSSISPDDESKNADVKGISNEYVFGGSGQEPLIRSVLDDNPTAVNIEIDALGGSAQLLTQSPEPSYPVDEIDATEHICEEEDVHLHGNTEKEFELTDLETDNDTSFGCGADEQNHTTSDTSFTLLSLPSCASKLQEEAAVPNSHSMGMCQVELEVCDIVDHCTSFERSTLAVYNEELSQVGHDDTILPEHSRTSELVTGTHEHMREGEAPLVNLGFCIGEAEVQPCFPRLEMHGLMIDDQDKSEKIEGISKDTEIMPDQEMKPLRDEVAADVCDKDLSKVDHEDTSIPEYSRTPELVVGTFEHYENDNASVIQSISVMIDDNYKSENIEGIFKEDEIMPQQEMKPLNDEITPDVYYEDLSQVEHHPNPPEHSRTSELVNGACEQLEVGNASVILPMSDMLEDLKEDAVPGSSEEALSCELHLEMNTTMIDDQYKSENVEGTSKEDDVMPQQVMKPLNEEITPNVYHEDLSKVEHEDPNLPEHSRTSELATGAFEQLKDGNASVILPISHMLEDLKEDAVPVSSEEVLPCELHPEMNTTMIDDQYKSENVEGTSKEDEIMPQQEMKPPNDEITPDVYDEDLCKVGHEDPNLHAHSRTSELVNGVFEQLEDGNPYVIQPVSDVLEDLKEDAVPAISEEFLSCELHPEMNTTITDDQNKSENVEDTSKEDEIRDAKLGKVEKSSKKPASATNQKKRSILIHGTPRRPIKIADMKENSTAQLKRDRLANATATKPLAGRKALGELSRWRP